MPNWVEQHLHVVGPKAEVDRFVRTGFSRRHAGQFDDELNFLRLCPLGRRKVKDAYPRDSGVVISQYRTRTQAAFLFLTAWDYPAEFYARLPKHWPSLDFACSVNGEMGDFGGVITIVNGHIEHIVEDYGEKGYSRRRQLTRIRAAMKRWFAFLNQGRDWRVMGIDAWTHHYMPFDGHFDDDFWFYFSTREEMARFRARYRTARPQRRHGDEWRRTR